MQGVDRADQMIGCYNIGQRSQKWWMRVFSYIIECAVLNAYILESHTNQSGHSQKGRKETGLSEVPNGFGKPTNRTSYI